VRWAVPKIERPVDCDRQEEATRFAIKATLFSMVEVLGATFANRRMNTSGTLQGSAKRLLDSQVSSSP
jgi:hypothetical protein